MINENIYTDVSDDFCGTTRAHKGGAVMLSVAKHLIH